MGLGHVFVQVAALRVGPPAVAALVRLLAVVDPKVVLEVATSVETLVATLMLAYELQRVVFVTNYISFEH